MSQTFCGFDLLQTHLKRAGSEYKLLKPGERLSLSSGDTIKFGAVEGILKVGTADDAAGAAVEPGPDVDATQVSCVLIRLCQAKRSKL